MPFAGVRTSPKEPSRKTERYFLDEKIPAELDFRAYYEDYWRKLNASGWKRLGAGRHRATFLSPKGKRVIKVSHHTEGVVANFHEAYYANHGDHMVLKETLGRNIFTRAKIPIPKVFGLARVGHNKLLSVICVEYVERSYEGWSLARNNPWIHDVDVDSCPQVGYTASGRLVCFDWARF